MISFSPDPVIAERQMNAVIYYLVAFGHIDGHFDPTERAFIREHVAKLVAGRADQALGPSADPKLREDVVGRFTSHFHEVVDQSDAAIRALFEEVVNEHEESTDFVLNKVKLRCYELFKQFGLEDRRALLDTALDLIAADGEVHPNEERFRRELESLLNFPVEVDDVDVEPVGAGEVIVEAPGHLALAQDNHPFFTGFEWHYADEPAEFLKQAEIDLDVIVRTVRALDEKRSAGRGRLQDKKKLAELAGAGDFLDGHTFVVQPDPAQDHQLLVLGDLHGCYSCLKAALLQADFFGKVQRFHDDPKNNPRMMLVLLGDYIDRGRFSYNGILRTVMQIFLRVPEHVFMLRGNHEYYVELNGRIYGGVKPAEAITSLQRIAPMEVFKAYKLLFEALPNFLFFDRTLFVHAGIPRDDLIHERLKDLASLNDSEMRFQMLWSDPSEADAVPLELQKANARFPFGRKQFKAFMHRIGATTMVRGHERVTEGFKTVYDDGEHKLLNLFSAGGATNRDLPEASNYREVTPMALLIRHKKGVSTFAPFVIQYERYNEGQFNQFFA